MSDTDQSIKPAAEASFPAAPSLVPALPPGGQPVCFIVDDEPGIQNILSNAATSHGFQVKCFRSAAKALKALETIKPALLFLDVSLEGSDAIDVIRGLGTAEFRGTVQLVSGKDAVTLEEVKRVGERHSLSMLPPLQKPFRLEAARSIVREYLARPVQETAPAAAKTKQAERSVDRIDCEAMLRKNWLEVWYQPKIDLKEMKFAGAEGLIRCRHPEKGILPPASFLPYADENTLIRLTELVLRAALTDWEKFAQVGFPFKLAVNIPVVALVKLPIHMIVQEHKPKNQDWPGMILEVTEDQVVSDITLVHEIATQLRIHNIMLAIDDFGTGYAHLIRLKEFPFAELKLDRTLVTNCGEDKANASLCQAAIELAHRFGAVAVGEGIETASELKALHRMGCDIGQGYLFAKPMPRDQLISSLVKNATAKEAL
jgi:EAL domain-containing protein (putative c-di-GMP-specific phosphodiesterase class I)/FixJ family two-component response regulator